MQIVVDADDTGGHFDLIEVLAQPGGGPPPHRHSFSEWFHVLEGTLRFTGEQNGQIVTLRDVGPGEVVKVPAQCWHGTINATDQPVRFTVAGQPGVMSRYFRQAGVPVATMQSPALRKPPGPAELAELVQHYGVEFWPG